MNEIVVKLKKLINTKHFRYGAPFFGFMCLGVLIIRETQSVRYEFRATKSLNREEIRELGIKIKNRADTLEEAYEKIKEIDTDNWENIRGPRLFEETPPS